MARLAGIAGVLLILCGYYLLWVPVDADFSDVVTRTRIAVTVTLIGSAMVLFYMHKKSK